MNERFRLDYELSTPAFVSASQPRVVYALLNIRANADFVHARSPVNIVALVDVSDSMKTPVLDDDVVDELEARGLLSPDTMDGMPIFRFEYMPDDLEERANGVCSLDFVDSALEMLAERLAAQDHFALVAFASEAQTLLTSRSGSEKRAIFEALDELAEYELGPDTLVVAGLQQALQEAERGRSPQHVDRIVLLTDGFAGDEDLAYGLAEKLAHKGLAVSTIGLGFAFNEGFLIGLAEATGGNAYLVFNASDLPQLFAGEFESSQSLLLTKATVELRPAAKVQIRRIYRIQPVLAELTSSPSATGAHLVNAGALLPQSICSVLVELIVPPNWRPGKYRVAEAIVSGAAPGLSAEEVHRCDLVVEVLAANTLQRTLPPASDVTRAVALAAAMRSQATALEYLAAGRVEEAHQMIVSIAERLQALGEVEAATTYREEAAQLAQKGEVSGKMTKVLRYATRKLTQKLS